MVGNYLNDLNDVQRKAVTTIDGPVMVIAGPGSGKTRVLTYRIAHIIEQGVAPWNILALTFTNKAAKEMTERISKVVGNRGASLMTGTFHSVFAKILRREADKIGYPSSFTIYDTADSKSVIAEIIKEMNLDKDAYKVNQILSRISFAKTNIISPQQYAKSDELLQQDKMNRRQYFHHIYSRYVQRCQRSGAMDFDDLLYKFFVLLHQNTDNVLQKYREQFHYVLVDEFQDTNFLQYSILKMLTLYPNSHQNICIVGDDAQSIYAFRGATISNILDFQNDFQNVKVIKLEQNYRSTIHIVKAANEIITNNTKQIKKEIWTSEDDGHKVRIIKALTDTEEARLIASMIQEQKIRYYVPNAEIAILYRTNAQSRAFEEHLRKQNIPYRIFGGLSFFQRKEIKDVIAYLRLIVNQNDSEALKRVINFPKRSIGKTTVDKMIAYASSNEVSLWRGMKEVEIPSRARTMSNNFEKLIQYLRDFSTNKNAYEVALETVNKTGILTLLKNDKTIEGVNKYQNLQALLDGIKEFVEEDDLDEVGEVDNKSLPSYLQNVSLMTDMDRQNEGDEFVTLMTVHSAKGLEFDAVYIVGMEENIFPSFMSMNSPAEIDEERRLFYVAITRARKFLSLSYANSRYQYGQIRYNDVSRFVEELPEDHIESPTPKVKIAPPPTSGAMRSTISRKPTRPIQQNKIDPSTFKPSPSHLIEEGNEVLHIRFGKGKVIEVDGKRDKRVATILFDGIENPRRRLMLKFAKLQIVE